jgi:dipeptidyl aminopeptidase/acylaminoacyl peptidase
VWIAVAAILVLGFSLVIAGATFCANSLRVPRVLSATPPGVETVEITANDNARLSAFFLKSSQPNGNCVAVLHGIKDSRASSVRFSPMFLDQGYSVLLPDSRAHGASGGEFVTYGLLEKFDVMAWARWMKGRGCNKLYGLGESLGGSILIQAAAIGPVFSAIVAESAYADLREIAEYRVRQMRQLPAFFAGPAAYIAVSNGMLYARVVDRVDLREVSPIRSIRQSTTPVLLIHGLDDWQTPPSNSERLAAANPQNSLWLVPRAGHVQAFDVEPEEFRRRVLAWFAQH